MNRLDMMRALKFTTEDLRANRDGKLSHAQHEKYKSPEIRLIVYVVIFGHLALVGGLLGVIAIVTGESAMWLVFGIVVALGALPFIMLQNEGNIKPLLKADIKNGVVKTTCGMALLEEKKGRNIYYTLRIDGIRMELKPEQAAVFKHGEDYCAYYLPNSRMLLSAEPASP